MDYGFFKVAAATPQIVLGNVKHNKNQIKEQIMKAQSENVKAIVFPELSLTGYCLGDLFLDNTLIKTALSQLNELILETKDVPVLCGVGVPIRWNSKLYNCIAVFYMGELLGLVPKRNIPNYSEFYEMRHFTPFAEKTKIIEINGTLVPFGNVLIDCSNEVVVSYEVCEDLWVNNSPSNTLASMGATIIMNASCSDEIIGKAGYRKKLIEIQSGKLLCGYVYADSGFGESTTDMVFAGHRLISENATTLAESELFTSGLTIADIDNDRLVHERQRMNTFAHDENNDKFVVNAKMEHDSKNVNRKVSKRPFVPSDKDDLAERCKEIIAIQSAGLVKRLAHINCKEVVIGLSGGLDSTLALLITVKAFDILGLDRKGILAVSMPCFGTTNRTKNNSEYLAKELEVTHKEIRIEKAVKQHFADIGHDEKITDVTYENSQARERTQVLMDLANKIGGIVIGTGDLSELALGWATYNGDHMSMYAVNASVPKTLVRYLVNYFALALSEGASKVLFDILDTPVSPELLPPIDGEISQKTEDLVGPYELHDFYLYYMLRYGFSPDKIFFMACSAFDTEYDKATIKKWLVVFYRRFFTQQFKRSCLPDGPKVGSVSVSPRGDWRMPSDASYALWLEIAEGIEV